MKKPNIFSGKKYLHVKYSEVSQNIIKHIYKNEKSDVIVKYSLDNNEICEYLFDKTAWTVDEALDWIDEKKVSISKKSVTASINREIKDEKHKRVAVASMEVEDRHGEVVAIDGWDIKNFKKNPVLLWLHNLTQERTLPIGKAKWIGFKEIDGQRALAFEPEFENETEFGRTINKFVDDGLLNSFSVGFIGLEKENNKFTKQELLEISLVPVPALAQAQFIQRSAELGVTKDIAQEFVERVEVRSAVPHKKYSLSDEGKAWDSRAAENRMRKNAGGPDKENINWETYRAGFTWYDNSNPESFASYKLPHHDIEDGRTVTVWRGVAAAMASLLGARGGVEVPESDKKAIYNHLVQHYKEFEKEVPEYRFVDSQDLKVYFEVVENELDNANFRDLKEAVKSIRHEVRQARAVKSSEAKSNSNEPLIDVICQGADVAIKKIKPQSK